MKNWITSHLPMRASSSDGHGESRFHSHISSAATHQIEQIERNLQQLQELKNGLTMLSNPRNKHSSDPLIRQLSIDANSLLLQTSKATENSDAILNQMKNKKLKPDHAGPHHQLISTTDVLIEQWEGLKGSYDAHTSSNRGH